MLWKINYNNASILLDNLSSHVKDPNEYDDWVEVAMSLHGFAISDAEILELFTEWSGRAGNFGGEKTVKEKLKYIHTDDAGIGAGSLFAWVKEGGVDLGDLEMEREDGTVSPRAAKASRSTLKLPRAPTREEVEKAKSVEERHGMLLDATDEELYLKKKGIKPHGVKVNDGVIYVPIYNIKGDIISAESIYQDSRKRAEKGTTKDGGLFPFGFKVEEIGEVEKILVAEGFATAASLYEATGIPSICVFGKSNIESTSNAIMYAYPNIHLTICGDIDVKARKRLKKNSKKTPKSEQEIKTFAKDCNHSFSFPDFGDEELSNDHKDFNDMVRVCGKDAVRAHIASIKTYSNKEVIPFGNEELPVLSDDILEGYAGDFVREVAHMAGVKNGVATLSFLSMMSLHTSRLTDVSVPAYSRDGKVVKRGYRTVNTGLFFIYAAVPSARKTSIQEPIFKPFIEADNRRHDLALIQYKRAAKKLETAERNIGRDMQKSEKGEISYDPSKRLAILSDRAEKYKVKAQPWITKDGSIEGIQSLAAANGGSVLLYNDDAGSIFDVICKKVSVFNAMVDGGLVRVRNAQAESRDVRRCRFCSAAAAQPSVIMDAFKSNRDLETGFGSRFLLYYDNRSTEEIKAKDAADIKQMVKAIEEGGFQEDEDRLTKLSEEVVKRIEEISSHEQEEVTLSEEIKDDDGDIISLERKEKKPHILKVGDEAGQVYLKYHEKCSAIAEETNNNHRVNWLKKAHTNACKIAEVIHFLESNAFPYWNTEISKRTMEKAVSIMEVLGEHANRTFEEAGGATTIATTQKFLYSIYKLIIDHPGRYKTTTTGAIDRETKGVLSNLSNEERMSLYDKLYHHNFIIDMTAKNARGSRTIYDLTINEVGIVSYCEKYLARIYS